MNKKILLITLSLIFCLTALFADPIIVEGYGKTYEDATNNSLLELSSFISTEVSSVTQSSLIVEGENVEGDSFSDNLVLSSYSKLIGVEYNKKQDVDGLKCIEATIPDSNSVQVQYTNRINDILNEINKTNSLIEKSNDANVKLQYLEFILSYIKEFKSYKFIILHLNDSLVIQHLDLSETALKVQYINLLNRQQKLLDDEISNLKLTLSEKEQQQSDKLNQVIAQRDKIIEDIEKAVVEEEKWRQGVRDSKTAEIINKADALKAKSLERKNTDTFLLIPSEIPLSMINQIESKAINYESSCNNLLEEIKTLRIQTENDFFEDKEKISNRKLSIAEKTNGKETEQSKQHTQYLINESKKSFFEQYKINRNTLLNAVEYDINKDYGTIINNIEELNNTNFIIDSRKDDVDITIGQYDGANNTWPVVVNYTILDKRIEMEFGLSYEDFTQTEIPSIGLSGAYSPQFMEYLEQVEVLEAYFADSESDPISIKLQYSVSSDKNAIHNYLFSVNKIICTRNDNNDQIIKSLLSTKQIEDFKFKTSYKKTRLYPMTEKLGLQEIELISSSLTLIPEWDLEIFRVNLNMLGNGIYTAWHFNRDVGKTITAAELPNLYRFDGWYKDKNCSHKWDFSSDVITKNITLWARPFNIGNLGPSGGLIFYDNPNYEEDGWRYLEAAPLSKERKGKVWGGRSTIVGGTSTKIGTGESNTDNIVSTFGYHNSNYAAKLCADLVVSKGGVEYDDWFLPSKEELNLMYENLKRKNLGGFSDKFYWSSSASSASFGINCAWAQKFSSGFQHDYYYRDFKCRIRPVRAF